jgi:ABC-type sugar transport system substrate-binding protein
MTGRHEHHADELRRLIAGEPVDRRTLLRAAAAGLALPAALSACSTTTPTKPNPSYRIFGLYYNPPIGDLALLITARAQELDMEPTLTVGSGGQLLSNVEGFNTPGSYNPVTNKPSNYGTVLVVPAIDTSPVPALRVTGSIESFAATAIRNGIRIVAYPTPLKHQTAAILADAVQGARMLATQAAAWARAHLPAGGSVLLVLPPASNETSLPYATYAATMEQAFRATLARQAPETTIAASATASAQDYPSAPRAKKALETNSGFIAVAGALKHDPDIQIVLLWNDDAAYGAAEALRRHHPHTPRSSLFVGALGLPSVASRETFTELQRDDVLRVVVAARARDLANAMVDLPHTLTYKKTPARDIELPLQVLTPHSSTLAAYSKDYARHPPSYSDYGLGDSTGFLNHG